MSLEQEREVVERYFGDRYIDRVSITPERAAVGEYVFNIDLAQRRLTVASFPDNPPDEWLSHQQRALDEGKFAWEVVARIKTRVFHTSEEIFARARSGELYDEDYYLRRGGGGPYVGYPQTIYNEDLTAAFSALAREIADRFPGARVLDIGCGPGVLVREMLDAGLDAHGVDVSRWCVENSVAPTVVHGSALGMPFPDRNFDVQISQDVMEHLHPDDLRSALAEQVRIAKPGGFIFHFVPFYEEYRDPVSLDAHLTNACRAWWIKLFADVPGLSIERLGPEDQYDTREGRLSRYFALKAS